MGANDGGSSAALLIELARRLHARQHEYTYWVVWLDGEEARESWTSTDSLYGSRWMAAELSRSRQLPSAVIVADMIGDRELGIRREAASTPWMTDVIWASAARLGYSAYFLPDSMAVEDDHAPFMRLGVPAALLIDFDFPPWHTAQDTLDKVSARSLEIVGKVILDALPGIEDGLSRSRGGAALSPRDRYNPAMPRIREVEDPGDDPRLEGSVREGDRGLRLRSEHDEDPGAHPRDHEGREAARRRRSSGPVFCPPSPGAGLPACRADQRVPVLNRYQRIPGMRAGASEAKIAEVPTALTSKLFDEREKAAMEYAEAMTFSDRKVGEDLLSARARALPTRRSSS